MDDHGRKNKSQQNEAIISEMLVTGEARAAKERGGSLMVDPAKGPEQDAFALEVAKTLQQTESDVRDLGRIARVEEDQALSWQRARVIVEQFRPVPWFIWRLSNFVFGRSGAVPSVPEGLVFGLRRLLFAAASDPILGSGEKVNTVKRSLSLLSGDVIGAASVVHAVCRRLQSCQYERIWRPILDDAIIRSQIGFYLGQLSPSFGAGRGMLAGFSGRSGLVILIATGTLEQARSALEMLAAGAEIKDVGVELYRCNPLQVSAMLLSAAGCGRDASFGTVAYASEDPYAVVEGDEQRRWLAAYTAAELVRLGKMNQVTDEHWRLLNYSQSQEKDDLQALVKMLVRRGHGWNWIMS